MPKTLIAIFFLISLSGLALAASSKPPQQAPSIKTEQQANSALEAQHNSDQQANDTNEARIRQQISSSTAKDKSHDQPKETTNETSEFWAIAGRTLKITDTLVVVFTFLLFLATLALYWATRDLVRDAKNNAQRQLRAYVFVQNIESFWTADKATKTITKWTFFPVWKNSGQTPTRSMVSTINVWVGQNARPMPDNFDFPDYGKPRRSMIGPGATMHGDRLELTVDQLQKIRAGTAHAYMWAWAEYNDVFEKTPRHRSEACFEIKVTGNPIYKEGGFGFALHGPFNGYDEDAYRKPQPYVEAS